MTPAARRQLPKSVPSSRSPEEPEVDGLMPSILGIPLVVDVLHQALICSIVLTGSANKKVSVGKLTAGMLDGAIRTRQTANWTTRLQAPALPGK